MGFYVSLLGPFKIKPQGDGVHIGKLTRKTRAILAYLVATARPHTRQKLYEWFCQEAADPAGTLRWHLSQIRRKVTVDLLQTDGHTVAVNPELIRSDLSQFRAVIDHLAGHSTEALADVVALYRGPFLSDITLKNAPEFDLWQLGERSRWQRIYEKGASVLITQTLRQGR